MSGSQNHLMTHLRSGRPAIIHKGTMFRIRTLRFLLLGLAAIVLVVSKPAFAELRARRPICDMSR